MKKSLIIIAGISSMLFAVVSGVIVYSYTQIDVSFQDISSVSIELETLSLSSLIKFGLDVLSGEWITAALDVVAGINFGLTFELTNNGLLPVYVPNLSYNLFINDIPIGDGTSVIDTTIIPGEKKQIQVMQNFQKDSLAPAITSIVDTNGILDIRINGIAYFDLLGIMIPIEFESVKQVSIIEEIQNQISQSSLN